MANKTVSLKITIDGKELDLAKTSVEQFEKTYTAAAQKLSSMKVGTEEWKKLNSELETADKAFKNTKDSAEGADGKFKSLRTQIRETTVQLQKLADEGKEGTKEFKDLSKKLDDLGDAQKRVAFQSGQFEDKLAALPGPIGKVGQGVKGLKESFDTFGKGLTISLGIIGLIVTAFIAIKEALGKTKEGTELLSQATTAFNKVLAPLFAILEKIGTIVLPIVIKGFEMLGSVVSGVAEFFGVKSEKVDEVTASLEKNNEAANTLAKAEEERVQKEKQLQEERTKKLKEESEKRKKIVEESEKVINEARLALMNDKDKEIEVAAQKHKENLKKLRANGNKGIELEEARYNKELLDINKKYNKLIEAEEQNRDKTRRSTIDAVLSADQKAIEMSVEIQRDGNDLTIEEEVAANEKLADIQNKRLLLSQSNRRKDFEDQVLVQIESMQKRKVTEQEVTDYLEEVKEQRFLLDKADQTEKINMDNEFAVKKINIYKKAADDQKKIEFEAIQDSINQLDKLSAAREFDYQEDIVRNTKKIEELKKLQKIEEDAAKGQADVLLKIRREYGDKINAIEIENTRTKRTQEEFRFQIALTYANAAQTVGQIFQQIAKDNKDLALLGLAIEKAAAIASIAINTLKNASKYGFLSPMGIAEMVAGTAAAAAVVVSYIAGVQQIKSAGQGTSSSSSEASKPAMANYGKNYEEGGMIYGPRHAQGGVMIEAEGGEAVMTRGAVTMFAPLLSAMNQMGGGTSFSKGMLGQAAYDNPKIENSINTQPTIIKTYVVSNELTSEAQKQARLKDLSTL